METARIAELLQPFLAPPEFPPRAGGTVIPSEAEPSAGERFSTVEGPVVLAPSQLQSISTYIDLLLRWNARVNLTAVRQPEEIVTRHFGESLFAARHLFPSPVHVGTAAPGRPVERSSTAQHLDSANDQRPFVACPERSAGTTDLIDLGSGAGFPGLPIKIWAPHLRLTLIESHHKKATFLGEVVRALTLTNVNIFAGRAEDFPAQADVVTLRAVERFEAALPLAARLMAPGGRLALLIGEAQADRARLLLPRLRWQAPNPIPLSRNRVLLVGESDTWNQREQESNC